MLKKVLLLASLYTVGAIAQNSGQNAMDSSGEIQIENVQNQTISPPVFSAISGFYTEDFQLSLSHSDPEVLIYYSLDGSNPSTDNLNGTTYYYKNHYVQNPGDTDGELLPLSYTSIAYTGEITISDRSNEPNKLAMLSSTFDNQPNYLPQHLISKATVVKAIAVKDGLQSKIISHTFFVSPEGTNRYTLPVMSLSVNEDLMYDYILGTNNAGLMFDQWREENPDAPADVWSMANYWKGSEAEKELNFTYFENGEMVLNHGAGIRNHGNSTRSFPNKSWRLYAKSQYGSSNFNHAFFDDSEFNSFKRLILRNSGNDTYRTLFRDAVVQKMMAHLNFETQDYQPSIVFLNGEYWGLFNIRERFDGKYFDRVYGIDEDDLDFLEYHGVISEGENTHYLAFTDALETMDMSTEEAYTFLSSNIDTENYADYLIAYMYSANYDWPYNNIEYWRMRTDAYNPNAPYGQDGRWRWVMKDMDVAFNGNPQWINNAYQFNMLNYATQPGDDETYFPEWSGFLINKSLENPTFKNYFVSRFADLLNTSFLPSRIIGVIDECQANIAPEVQEHIDRWNNVEDYAQWEENVDVLRQFANLRPDFQRAHIKNHFNLEDDFTLIVDVDDAQSGFVKVNTIDLVPSTVGVSENPYPWSGIYFSGVPVTLTAQPMQGYAFSHWSGASESTEATIEVLLTENAEFVAHFVPITTPAEELPIYYWVMTSDIANDTPLTTLAPTYSRAVNASMNFVSCLTGYPFSQGHEDWRTASMERRNSPTAINYISEANYNVDFEDEAMRGIQIKQPFQANGDENQIQFQFSTVGFENIQLRFAAKDEGAASEILVDYKTSSSEEWSTAAMPQTVYPIGANYELVEVDFSAIQALNNNPNALVRLRFNGPEMTAENGDRVTFNNISIHGDTYFNVGDPTQLTFVIYPNPTQGVLHIEHAYSDVNYTIYSIDGRLVGQGKLTSPQLDITHLNTGIYQLKLETSSRSISKKIIKTN